MRETLLTQVFIYFSTPNLIADFTLLRRETFPWGKERYKRGGGVLSYHFYYYFN